MFKGLNEYFSSALTEIVRNDSKSGTLARTILAANFEFLLSVDEEWVRGELVDFFGNFDNESDFHAVWDGFLFREHINNQNTFDCLEESFFQAISRFESVFSENLSEKFLKVCAYALLFFVDNPLEDWIRRLLQSTNEKNRVNFAYSIKCYLSKLNDFKKDELWNSWIKRNWLEKNSRCSCAPWRWRNWNDAYRGCHNFLVRLMK